MRRSPLLYLIGRFRAWVQVCRVWRAEGDAVQARGAAVDCRFYWQGMLDFWRQTIRLSAREFGLICEF